VVTSHFRVLKQKLMCLLPLDFKWIALAAIGGAGIEAGDLCRGMDRDGGHSDQGEIVEGVRNGQPLNIM
jgi:hypothetical protein